MDTLSRRDVVGAGLGLAALGVAQGAQAAETAPATGAASLDVASTVPGGEVIALWPEAKGKSTIPGDIGTAIKRRVDVRQFGTNPPDRWVFGVAKPVMIALRPARPDGSAALVMPGGSYSFQSFDNEGTSQARWLLARGTTVFLLMYRLPSEGWANRHLAPLQDAQRAMRLIRARSAAFGVDPARVMALGFSAGGHLCGSLATRFGEKTYEPVDAADQLSARPDLAALMYPVVNLLPPLVHPESRDRLLGPGASEAQARAASVDANVDASTPPLFIAHAVDDNLVPVGNAIALFQAAQGKGRPVELHVYAGGGHGFGVNLPASVPASNWPRALEAFAKAQGLMR